MLGLAPTSAYASNAYTVFTLTYQGAAARVFDDAASDVDSLNHTPRLGFVAYGGDWFMKVRLTPISRPTGAGDTFARFAPIAGGEVGVHLPGEAGNLAVGLVAEAVAVGVEADGTWRRGGRGFDGGVSVHYAFPAFGFLRFDPSVAAGASTLFVDEPQSTGVWAHGELELIAKVASSISVVASGGIDVRRYSADEDTFDVRTVRFDVGIAVHDLYGLGANDP